MKSISGSFTRREQEILFRIAEGLSLRQIAEKLALSEPVVAALRKEMLMKTGARTTAEMVAISISRFASELV